MNDLRFALRLLAKQPGFTAVAVLTMANAVLLRPLDFPQPD
jgi:hypothetical protein